MTWKVRSVAWFHWLGRASLEAAERCPLWRAMLWVRRTQDKTECRCAIPARKLGRRK